MLKGDKSFENRKQSLIELIEWYRDEWHRGDFCHSKMIEKIKVTTNEQELHCFEQTVDMWLD